MNIIKNITNSSVVVQWDTVDDVQDTNYTVTWTIANESDVTQENTEQTSYTLTGLTLNTVYNINVTATNKCGQGEEFRTSVLFSEVTSSGISPTIITVNSTLTVVPTTIPTSVTNIAESSFATVTPPTASTTVVHVTATSDSFVFPTPTTDFTVTTVSLTFTVVPTTTPTSVTGSEGFRVYFLLLPRPLLVSLLLFMSLLLVIVCSLHQLHISVISQTVSSHVYT